MHRRKFWFYTFGFLLILNFFYLTKIHAFDPLQNDEQFICGLNSSSLDSQNLGEILAGKTGNRMLDTALQNDALELQKVFGISARMFLLREANGANALAVRIPLPGIIEKFGIAPQSTSDGMVFFGTNLLNSQYNFVSKRGFAIPSIMGHEYAHILQYKLNFPLKGKWQELHADYLAGWYTAHRARLLPQNIRESMATFFDNGDNDLNSFQHHGSPQERAEAFLAGAQLNQQNANLSGREAYRQGGLYLLTKESN